MTTHCKASIDHIKLILQSSSTYEKTKINPGNAGLLLIQKCNHFKKCISQEILIQQIPPDATITSATKWTI